MYNNIIPRIYPFSSYVLDNGINFNSISFQIMDIFLEKFYTCNYFHKKRQNNNNNFMHYMYCKS